jgi:hypothetical protein
MRTKININGSKEQPIEELLEEGADPAIAFRFGVWTVSSYEE